ncbi:hypothetical protein CMI47_21440 [Candidatus Pacearchaeota archaeon]|jgi:hypothetical protein|nr:hypothetical protein [Candidatus Pacearchaeota archaeon]|tara:strand:+ start:1381 stop:1860 length:480 start_codon:yes stop_codon:yes gene_type:complete
MSNEPKLTCRLQEFMDEEVANEAHGGDSPTTLGTALDSLHQMPDEVLAELLGETLNELNAQPSIHAELEAMIQAWGRDTVYEDSWKRLEVFHAFEIATDSSYHVGVYRLEAKRDEQFQQLLAFLGDDVETTSSGTVNADEVEAAIDLIRAGQWSYSQRV